MNHRKTATVTVSSKYITSNLSPKRPSMPQKKPLKVSDSARRPRTHRSKIQISQAQVAVQEQSPPPVPKLITDSEQHQNLETIGEVSEASHTLIQSGEFQKCSQEIRNNNIQMPPSLINNKVQNAFLRKSSENDLNKIESLDSEEINIAIEENMEADQGKSSIGMQSGDSTSHKRKPSMFAELNMVNGSKTARISIPSPMSLKEKFYDNKIYKNDYLQLRPKESSETDSTNIYTTRRRNLESELKSLELMNEQPLYNTSRTEKEMSNRHSEQRQHGEILTHSPQSAKIKHRRNTNPQSDLIAFKNEPSVEQLLNNVNYVTSTAETPQSTEIEVYKKSQKKNLTISEAQTSLKLKSDLKAGDLVIENERLKTTILVLNQKLNDWTDTQTEILNLKKKNRELNMDSEKFRNEIQRLKNQLCSKDCIISQNEQTIKNMASSIKLLDQELEDLSRSRDTMKKDNQQMNKKIIQLEQEIFESKTVGLKLIDQLKSCEKDLFEVTESSKKKIDSLQKIIENVEKHGPIYIARKQDQIDRALANFLNTYPNRDKLNILFIRESEGVYKFGQRRVFMKLGKNEQLGVQVGGGFVTISDFIEKYTQKEVEKIRRGENHVEKAVDQLSHSPRQRNSPLASPRSSQMSDQSKNQLKSPKPVPINPRFSSPIKNKTLINYKKSKSPNVYSRRLSIPGQFAI